MSGTDKPAPLMPKADRVWIVRWVREDGSETRHRTYLRRHPAERFIAALLEDGRDAAMFSSATARETS
ncbi:hypothetical protein BJ986_000211 [Phycicoccus badiiscoriae]|uniref:Uncharacterized protein n=1 Tax=Pedococcus badiiscoriae TaxID=642776 RepID=A0A852WGD0_9MICO|nr:hypothetical protein [Pedococcus badiiscoriae]NYG05724.1 hypothetical protein [Pedococcus badiiscoriae]